MSIKIDGIRIGIRFVRFKCPRCKVVSDKIDVVNTGKSTGFRCQSCVKTIFRMVRLK